VPTATAAAGPSNPSSARAQPAHPHNDAQQQTYGQAVHGDDDATANATSAAAASQPKKRKQWNVGPVALKGADDITAPPAHLFSQSHEAGESHRSTFEHGDEDDHDFDGEDGGEDGGGGGSGSERRGGYDEQDGQQHQQLDEEGEISMDLEAASYSREHFDADSAGRPAALEQSIPEDELPRPSGEPQPRSPPALCVEEEVVEEDMLPPLSPPPLSLRKKDVSLLRESLELLAQARPTEQQRHLAQQQQQQQQQQQRARVMRAGPGPVPVPALSPFSGSEESLYNPDLTPHSHSHSHAADAPPSSAAAAAIAAGVEPPSLSAPTSSHSPTLPSRGLGSSASSRRAASAASARAHSSHDNGDADADSDAIPEQLQVQLLNVRSSVSFASDTAGGEEPAGGRPSTPLQTDKVGLAGALCPWGDAVGCAVLSLACFLCR
jgi:hypothetical protein